jgi:carboxypeptidase PM20D1
MRNIGGWFLIYDSGLSGGEHMMVVVHVVLGILGILFLVCAGLAANTLRMRAKKVEAGNLDDIVLNEDEIARKLSEMIKIPTITSDKMELLDEEAFCALHSYLHQAFPLVHKTLEREIVNRYGLLYRWKGTGSLKKPFLLAAHMDVVPVDERTRDTWKYGAFSGQIADGYVWGRGALDMKGHLTAVMESIEYLLRQGYKPGRDIYLALGFDEERLGLLGARNILELLRQRGIRLDFALDEGGTVMREGELGISAGAVMIGICEKGYADVRLTAKSTGGHASRPPKRNAVGELCKAIVKLEKNPMKPSLNAPLRFMLQEVGGHMRFPLNVIAANLSTTKALLFRSLSENFMGNAFIRSTMVPTMLKGAVLQNVLPERAEAIVSCRVSPDNSVRGLVDHIKRVVGSDIVVEIEYSHEPSMISTLDSEAFRLMKQTAAELFKGHLIAPYMMVAASDSRWYTAISDNVYRFGPFRSIGEDKRTLHSTNERMSIESLCEGTKFFARFIQRAAT